MTLGQKIRSERKAKGWTREKLAVEAEVSYDTIVRVELDQRDPNWKRVFRIARALELDLNEIADTLALLVQAS